MTSSEIESPRILRIIDASLNRVGEGLRLLEELARLLLDDAVLTQRLKAMRHELLTTNASFQQQLLRFRNARGDVGAELAVPGEEKERDLTAVLVANSRRVQESLRTLEELAKVSGKTPGLDSHRFQQARFELYTLEQELLSRLLRQDKRRKLSGLYAIIDMPSLGGHHYLEVAEQVIRGGAGVIQLRDKTLPKGELLSVADELRALCTESGVLFIVNDYLDVALAADADGLHLGQDDLPVTVARRLLPPGKLLGCSVTTAEEATRASSDGADYIAVGPVYPTPTKETGGAVGLGGLRQVRQAVTLPLVAIGGININNVAEVVTAGADAVAVIGALLAAGSPEQNAKEITAALEALK